MFVYTVKDADEEIVGVFSTKEKANQVVNDHAKEQAEDDFEEPTEDEIVSYAEEYTVEEWEVDNV